MVTEQQKHETWMRRVLELAQFSEAAGEVPVGAVVVREGEIIGEGYNQPISQHDPSAHAEIVALRTAAQQQANYRLNDCDLYVSLEPCMMCAGAMIHARIRRLIFGASDPKTGVAGSADNLFTLPFLNHTIDIHGGVLAQECGHILKRFFANRRALSRRDGRIIR